MTYNVFSGTLNRAQAQSHPHASAGRSSADATATPSSLTSLKLPMPAYPGCPGKEAVKWVSVCLPR